MVVHTRCIHQIYAALYRHNMPAYNMLASIMVRGINMLAYYTYYYASIFDAGLEFEDKPLL